jgi:AcrR family transcriptional regulator
MTMAAVAAEAGVALDTVYASVGRKPKLVALLVETAVSGSDDAVPAAERDYVRQIRAAEDAGQKLEIYARALRLIAERRRRNMATFAADLVATGQVRSGLEPLELADLLWAMGAPEFYSLLVNDASWSPEQFDAWLLDSWRRLILAPTNTGGEA